MTLLFDRLRQIKDDPTQQVVDLLLFLTYFSICLYAGGVAYQESYSSSFALASQTSPTDVNTAVLFVSRVLSVGWYAIVSAIYVLAFIVFYYLCRYVFRPWFGFFLLSLLLYFTFLGCTVLGEIKGDASAREDSLTDTTTKPVIKLFGMPQDVYDYAGGSFHLLSEGKQHFFVFEPIGVEGSQLVIHAVKKNSIKHYEVTAQ